VTPLERVERALEQHGSRHRGPGSWTCPAHDDRKASLSTNPGDDGRVLVCCHRGCTTAEVVAALGLGMGDLFPDDGNGRGQGRPAGVRQQESPPLPDEYEERVAGWAAALDAERLEVLTTRRGLTPRTIRTSELGWDGECITIPVRNRGGQLVNVRRWRPYARDDQEKYLGIAGHNGMRLFPGPPDGRYALLVEGEFDVLVGRQHHLPTVTSTGGAGKWRQEWSALFNGKQVWVMPDCDQAGRDGADKIAASLHAAGVTVEIVDLGLPDKHDLTDWFVTHQRTVEELRERLRAARRWRPPPELPRLHVDPPRPRRVPAPGAASDEKSWEAARIADAGVVPSGATTVEPGRWLPAWAQEQGSPEPATQAGPR
jgi:hypothetical protein